jgi:hypothetical protein
MLRSRKVNVSVLAGEFQYKRLGTLRVSTSGTILFENCSSAWKVEFSEIRVHDSA